MTKQSRGASTPPGRPSSPPRRSSVAPPRRSEKPRAGTLPASPHPSARTDAIPRAPVVPKINNEDDVGTNTTNTSTVISPEVTTPRSDILTVTSGPAEGKVYRLKYGETWLGRSDDCDIILLQPGVSRRHACIMLSKTRVVLRDNNAKNGTFVNDCAVTEHVLRPGEEIQLGAHATLLYSQTRDLDQMERKKAASIANMVAGVAHQLNTPLGVANTANALIESLAEELRGAHVTERVAELLGDLRASAGLVSKNLKRTDELVRSFKQLSAKELVDERRACDLASIVNDCIESARPATEKQGVTVVTHWPSDAAYPWVGYAMSLYKVVEHLLQNSLRYGYEGSRGGVVDIRLKAVKGRYRLEVEDYGVGVEPELQSRLFEPFASANRDGGAGGLGLAVVHTIVTNLFGGTITCNSVPGKGTKFIVLIPSEVEEVDG